MTSSLSVGRSALGSLLVLLAFFGLSGPDRAQAQEGFSVAVGAHALTVPWIPGPMTAGLNPAVAAGWDRDWRSSEHWRLFWALRLGFFRHRWWMTGFSLVPELGVSRSVPGGFHADLSLGLGYLHYFWRRETMELKGGRYVEAMDLGKPSLLLPLSASFGYRGDEGHRSEVQPFVTARWGLQGLFLKEVPVMTHFQLLGGVRIQEGRREKEGGRRP